MKYFNIRKAFSLTELLIVLVIVSVLFAAMAPIMTKRHFGAGRNEDSVWHFAETESGDAYFDSGIYNMSSSAFVGFPNGNKTNLTGSPASKVVVRATKSGDNVQNMIQFRYGDDTGLFAGVMLFDSAGNLETVSKQKIDKKGSDNTAFGPRALNNASAVTQNTAIGASALVGTPTTSRGSGSASPANVAVGANAGGAGATERNVFVGANAGNTDANSWYNVGVGANTYGAQASGTNNAYAGAMVASAGFGTSHYNSILGSNYYAESSIGNTIIGYDVYSAGSPYQRNLTAVGYNSCLSVSTSVDTENYTGSNTCIGFSSAQNKGLSAVAGSSARDVTLQTSFDTDNADHIYIGGSPQGLGGRSVLEVHNFSNTKSKGTDVKPNIGPTVVLNSNLVVRGNMYFPTKDGYVRTHDYGLAYNRVGKKELGRDKCRGRCVIGGHKKWRNECNVLNIIIGWAIGTVLEGLFMAIATATGQAYAVILGGGVVGGLVGSLFPTSGYNRLNDPISGSAISFMDMSNDNGNAAPACANSIGGYPTADECPNLKLSDKRLKDVIGENKDSIEKILHVMPYNYTFKSDKDNIPQVGVMAQDLQNYSPNSVNKDEDGYLHIRWDEIFFATINSTVDLNKKVTSLSDDVENMNSETLLIAKSQKDTKKRIDSINKRINKLEK